MLGSYNVTNLLDWYDNLKNHEITFKAREHRINTTRNYGNIMPGYIAQREPEYKKYREMIWYFGRK